LIEVLISVFPDPEQIYTNHGMVTTMVWCNGEGLTETLVTLVYFARQTAAIIQATNKPLAQGDSCYRKAVSLCHNRKANAMSFCLGPKPLFWMTTIPEGEERIWRKSIAIIPATNQLSAPVKWTKHHTSK
jgi:hypothetical protein